MEYIGGCFFSGKRKGCDDDVARAARCIRRESRQPTSCALNRKGRVQTQVLTAWQPIHASFALPDFASLLVTSYGIQMDEIIGPARP